MGKCYIVEHLFHDMYTQEDIHSIDGVFSTRELAETYIEDMAKSGNLLCSDYSIEEEEVFEDEPIVTNGDRIRAMTNEELANFIACDNMCLHCDLYGKDCMNMEFLGCEDGILKWLKQEVDNA